MTDLLKLAERCEAAVSEDQSELLIEAWETVYDWPLGLSAGKNAERFLLMLNCGAYESAAMTLVPEGWVWLLQIDYGLPGRARVHDVPNERFEKADAATPALALCAAALRARASKEGQSNV